MLDYLHIKGYHKQSRGNTCSATDTVFIHGQSGGTISGGTISGGTIFIEVGVVGSDAALF